MNSNLFDSFGVNIDIAYILIALVVIILILFIMLIMQSKRFLRR